MYTSILPVLLYLLSSSKVSKPRHLLYKTYPRHLQHFLPPHNIYLKSLDIFLAPPRPTSPPPKSSWTTSAPQSPPTMSPHSRLCRRLTWHLCRARRQLERRMNGPPAMRTRSRVAAISSPAQVTPATPNTPADKTGTLTKKPSTKKQLLASSKRLGRKRLALKRHLEKKKKDMDEKGKRVGRSPLGEMW